MSLFTCRIFIMLNLIFTSEIFTGICNISTDPVNSKIAIVGSLKGVCLSPGSFFETPPVNAQINCFFSKNCTLNYGCIQNIEIIKQGETAYAFILFLKFPLQEINIDNDIVFTIELYNVVILNKLYTNFKIIIRNEIFFAFLQEVEIPDATNYWYRFKTDRIIIKCCFLLINDRYVEAHENYFFLQPENCLNINLTRLFILYYGYDVFFFIIDESFNILKLNFYKKADRGILFWDLLF